MAQQQIISITANDGLQKLMALQSVELQLVAGVGFINAQIGDPMTQVLKRWGNPVATDKSGLLDRTTKLLYQPDKTTRIIFSGKDKLENITVEGWYASAVHTRTGARFAIKSRSLATLYTNYTSKIKKNKIDYPALATQFGFTEGRLRKIEVYGRR